jgi:hypothetical protein
LTDPGRVSLIGARENGADPRLAPARDRRVLRPGRDCGPRRALRRNTAPPPERRAIPAAGSALAGTEGMPRAWRGRAPALPGSSLFAVKVRAREKQAGSRHRGGVARDGAQSAANSDAPWLPHRASTKAPAGGSGYRRKRRCRNGWRRGDQPGTKLPRGDYRRNAVPARPSLRAGPWRKWRGTSARVARGGPLPLTRESPPHLPAGKGRDGRSPGQAGRSTPRPGMRRLVQPHAASHRCGRPRR